MTDDNNGAIHTDFVRGQRARDGGAYTPALRWGDRSVDRICYGRRKRSRGAHDE
jgi:hypothetical protein